MTTPAASSARKERRVTGCICEVLRTKSGKSEVKRGKITNVAIRAAPTAGLKRHADPVYMKEIIPIIGLFAMFAGGADPSPKKSPNSMEDAVRVQVLLDRANFGPGKIDGHLGGFTAKALVRYRAAEGLTEA